MKSENGITLVSLVTYVIVMTIVLVIISSIINTFYQNTDSIQADTEEILQFNNFNIHFLKEVKLKDNKVDDIKDNYILFSSGNSFSFDKDNKKIYYNDIEICTGVENIDITFGTYTDNENLEIEDKTIINVDISFKNFNKAIRYKVEEIY